MSEGWFFMSSGSDLVHAKSVEVRRFIFSVMQSVLIRMCVGFFGDLKNRQRMVSQMKI